jgi:hypothetical protein
LRTSSSTGSPEHRKHMLLVVRLEKKLPRRNLGCACGGWRVVWVQCRIYLVWHTRVTHHTHT